jgi:hypothetical protein
MDEPVVNDLLGKAREMHRGDRRRGQRLQHEVAIRHGIERIGSRPIESQRFRCHRAVDRKRGAGERAGSERRLVEPAARVSKPTAVARRHLHIREEMVAESDRLSGLQMGQPRHDGRRMGQRLAGERALIGGELLIDTVDRVADPEPEIGCHLVIARTRGVKPAGRWPDQFGQPRLDVHVNILERALEAKFAALDL